MRKIEEDFKKDWEQRKLGDIFEEYSEKDHAELPALTIIQGGGTIRRDESDRALQYDKKSLSNYKKVDVGDFIVHLRSFEGGLEMATNTGIVSPAYHIFHGEKVDSRFYYSYFRSKQFINTDLKPHVYGIRDGRSIDIEGMKTIEIPWTILDEQKAIGNCIDTLDHLITLHQRKLEKLKLVKKSMLEKMFPKNGSSVPEIRFKGFTDDWEQRKFNDIATRESAVRKSSPDCPSIEYEDVVAEAGILNKDIRLKDSEKNGIIFDGSQVLYGKLRPYLHNWHNPDFEGVAVGDWWVLKPIHVDKSFLYRLIQTQKFDDIANQSSGSKMPRADWNLVSNSEFSIPPLIDEQVRIGTYFNDLDNLITLHQRKLEKLKLVKKSMLEKMFPKNGSSVPEIRFNGFTDDWEQRKAIDIADYSKGNGYSKGDLTDAGTPIILYGRLYTKYQFAISEVDTFAVPRNGAVYSQGNEVIVPASGETAEDIARASAVEKSGVLLGGDLNILRPFDFINPLFLALAISNGEPQKELAKKAQGKSVVHIHNTDIQEVTIAYPSRTEQDRIVSVFRQLDNLITLHQRKVEKLQIMKKSMLEKMFV